MKLCAGRTFQTSAKDREEIATASKKAEIVNETSSEESSGKHRKEFYPKENVLSSLQARRCSDCILEKLARI